MNSIIQEGAWDCDACKTQGIGGLQDSCPNCGQRRPDDVVFYLPDNARQITDPQQIDRALSGGDWLCKYCGFHNRAYQTSCQSCGAVLESDNKRQKISRLLPTSSFRRKQATYAAQTTDSSARVSEQSDSYYASPSYSKKAGESTFKVWLLSLTIIAVFLGSGWGIYHFFIDTNDVPATVSGFSWSREIDIETYGTVREEDWSVPDKGRIVDTDSRIRTYRQEFSHYETRTRQVPYTTTRTETYSCSQSLGNGMFSTSTCTRSVPQTQYRTESYQEAVYRSVPVYDTWYTYDIEKWHKTDTAKSKGTDHDPYWPEVEVTDTQRPGKKSESYTIYFTDDQDKQHQKQVDYQVWQDASLNQQVVLQINRQGNVVEVKFGG